MTLLTQAVTFAVAIARVMFVVSFFVSLNAFLALPTVADAQVAPTCSITASPSPVTSGGSVTLSWYSQNGSTATLTDYGTVGLTGSVAVPNVTAQKTYVLNVTNGSGTVSCSTTVTVGTTNGNGSGVVPACAIDSNVSRIGRNQPVQLSWSTNNGISATLSSIGNVQLNGNMTVYPQATTTYILNVTGNGVSNSCSRTITVDQNYTGFPKCTLGADPVLINNNTGSTTLTWTTEDASSVSIGGIGEVAANGSYTVYGVSGTRTYVLTAVGPNGSHTCSETVYGNGSVNGYNDGNFVYQVGNQSTTGTPENPGCYISVSPRNVTNGQATLSWIAAGAYSATISGMGSVATSGNNAIAPQHTTTYTLTAFGANGVTRTCSTTANVSGTIDPYTYLANTGYGSGVYTRSNTSNDYNDIYSYYARTYPYAQRAYGQGSPVSGRRVVSLNDVPYTGVEDVFGALFSLATLVTSGYGATKFRFA